MIPSLQPNTQYFGLYRYKYQYHSTTDRPTWYDVVNLVHLQATTILMERIYIMKGSNKCEQNYYLK